MKSKTWLSFGLSGFFICSVCAKLTKRNVELKDERLRPMLASEWIASDFGRKPKFTSSLHAAMNPDSSAAFHRGAFLDNNMQTTSLSGGEPDVSPEPAPGTIVPPLEIPVLNGKHIIRPSATESYLFSIYYPEDKFENLWFNAPLQDFFRLLPPSTHAVFAVSSSTPSPLDTIQRMFERCSNISNFEQVKRRVHFLAAPLSNDCNVQTFPKCDGDELNWMEATAAAWGSVRPKVVASWQEGGVATDLRLETSGDTGWLVAVTQMVRRRGASLEAPLVLLDGDGCNASGSEDLGGKVVMVERGTCTFFSKVQNAADRGAVAVMIWSKDSDDLHKMTCSAPDPCAAAGLGLPAVMVGRSDGRQLAVALASGAQVRVSLAAEMLGEHWFGVDHEARLREVGNVPIRRQHAQEAWGLVALEAEAYAYEQRLRDRLSDPRSLAVPIWDGADKRLFTGGDGLRADVSLPGREVLAQFDRLHVHLQLACPGAWDRTCGAWDYLVELHACPAPDDCGVEVARWVTPYGRPGRWLSEATAVLPLLRRGGRVSLRLSQPAWSGQAYRPTLALVFSRRGGPGAGVPVRSYFLFGGGRLDAGYNRDPSHEAVRVEVGEEVGRGELHAVVSGHGWGTDADNCAEFCPSQHAFSVRPALAAGPAYFVSRRGAEAWANLSRAGEDRGCEAQVGDGVTPNQYGTWRFGRAGWCPGGAVTPAVVDVTSGLTAGLEAVVAYQALVRGAEFAPRACRGAECAAEGFPPSISLRAYLVLFGPDH